MESSTKTGSGVHRLEQTLRDKLLNEPHGLEQALPVDLEGSARQCKALLRKREIRSAVDLLRLVLMYVLSDWSLKLVAGWAYLVGIGYLSDVAVLKRVRGCSTWLGWLIASLLRERCQMLQESAPLHVRLMDASVITRPGAQGTDWRLHLGMSLWPLGIDGVEISDAQGGESLARFTPRADEIRVADRGYAFVSSLAPVLAGSGWVVTRINWQNLPLETEGGERFDLIAWLKRLSVPSEQAVWLSTPQGRFGLRLIAGPLPQEAAERARARARKNSAKKRRTPSANTLLAAGFLLLLSNLSAVAWPIRRILWLYRLRWQIELAIRRLKSLIEIDHVRAQDPHMVQSYLLGKLLVALMLDELLQQVSFRQPDWFLSLERPLSVWRMTQFLWEHLRQWVMGHLDWQRLALCLPVLRRYLCDSPRARPQQLAWARAFLDYQAGFLTSSVC